MDLQKVIDNAIEAQRAEEMKNSIQLTLGELVLKLEAVSNKKLPVFFDTKRYRPTGLGSWRGSYRELSIQYKDGGCECYEQPKPTCQRDEFGYHHFKCECGGSNTHDTTLPKTPTVNDLLRILKLAQGKYFIGYKGGDFTMGKTTPLWVANYGESGGFDYEDESLYNTAVVDVTEGKKKVVINTKGMNY